VSNGIDHAQIAKQKKRRSQRSRPSHIRAKRHQFVTHQKATARAGRIMYVECKAGSLTGSGRIGRVTFSQTGRTLYYRGQKFQSLKGAGFKSNYFDVLTGEDYWISGPKRNGGDALYGGNSPIEIDDDVREDYWRTIRRQPRRINEGMA